MRIVIQNNTVQYVVPGPWLFQTWWNMLSKKSTKKKGMNEWMCQRVFCLLPWKINQITYFLKNKIANNLVTNETLLLGKISFKQDKNNIILRSKK